MSQVGSLPPLAGLRAFTAFAETGSVVKAAAALNVSHPAISQQLRAIEAHLSLALFDRSGPGLKLTAEGRLLAEACTTGFGAIARAVEELTGADAGRPVMLTTTPSFATSWLLPRLPDFRRLHPDIDLMIDPTPATRKLGPGGFDLAVRYGDGTWPGTESQLIVQSPVVMVASPELIAATPALAGCAATEPGQEGQVDVSALAGMPLLQELGTNEATETLERLGLTRSAGSSLTALPGNMMIEAARAGQGVATVARVFLEADIAAGRLRVLHSADWHKGYWLVTPQGVLRRSVRAFATWLKRSISAPV